MISFVFSQHENIMFISRKNMNYIFPVSGLGIVEVYAKKVHRRSHEVRALIVAVQ